MVELYPARTVVEDLQLMEKKSSGCLLSTVLELTSLINSDFTWTKVSKGCRSSSRRPRRSNTINLDRGALLTKDSKGLEMPVSESEKLGVSVLGCHFSEKAEHIPIKKRRFLFRASSPPRNNPNSSLEVAERHTMSPKASSYGLQFNPNAKCLPATSQAVTGKCERDSNDDKVDVKKLVKDDDFSGISILAAAACSNSLGAEADRCEVSGIVSSVTKNLEVPKTVEFSENDVKSEKLDSLTSAQPSKGDGSTLNNTSSQAPLESEFCNTIHEPIIPKSPARDVRFSWDLNTVMDAWEEPLVGEHEVSASDAAEDKATFVEEKKNDYTKDNSEDCENKELNLGNLKPDGYDAGNRELLSREFDNGQHAVVVKTESLNDKHIDSSNDVIPVTSTLTVESPTPNIFSKWANLNGATEAVDTHLSMDCSVPPGFDHCLNLCASKENVGVPSTISPPTTQTVMIKHDLSLTTATPLESGPHQSGFASDKVDDEGMTKMELTTNVAGKKDLVIKEETDNNDSKAISSSLHDAARSRSDTEAPLENGFGYDNSESDNRVEIGYDSQYEDGELRESSMHAWKEYELNNEENEHDMENGDDDFNMGIIVDAHETGSQNGQEGCSGGSGKEANLTSSVVLPERLESSDEVLSGSVQPNETIRQDTVHKANQSYEWKMNVSGWDLLPENQRISASNFTKTRNFTGRKFSYGEQKDGFEAEDIEMKAEGSRFYRKESHSRVGGPSTRDVFLNSRGRFRMQGCSSSKAAAAAAADGLTSRPERERERESGGLRSFGRGRYSPHHRPSGRGGGMWNRSPERGRDLKGPSFFRSMLEDSGTVDHMTNEGGPGGMDPSDSGRPNSSSYVTRRPFRSRSPMNREANDFRARLGLRPTGDTGHDRFVNAGRGRGRGRSVRYGEGGPRGRYHHGPASDECDEFMTEYSHPFPRRRRCFSPIERRGNNNICYQHHQSGSRSPSRPRTRSPVGNNIGFRRRSRSPNFRPDTRIRRPRSPGYRDHGSEYNPGPRNNNSSPPSSRWVNYKERPVFDRRSPPPPGRTEEERLSFYDSSRKPKQNEYYRSGHPGRFSDVNEGGRGRPNNGFRRGGFVRRYMDGPTKRFQYDEDGFGRGFDARDKLALELHARSNPNSNSNPDPKPCSNGTDTRFRDFPRRVREDGRRSREGKDSKEESEHIGDDFERRPRGVKDQSTTTSTNIDSMMPNEVKEDDNNKPILGSN